MDNLLNVGGQLTLYGMGLVFLMLASLWVLMVFMLKLDKPDAKPNTISDREQDAEEKSGLDPALTAAITIAVMNHQAVRLKQAAPAMRTHQPGELPSRWVFTGRTRQNKMWQPERD